MKIRVPGGGLYAAQFPGHIKIGCSNMLHVRLSAHRGKGAIRLAAVVIPVPDSYDGYTIAEEDALDEAERIGQRKYTGRRAREEFTDLPFEVAIECILDAATRHHGGPLRLYDIELDERNNRLRRAA